MQAICERWRLCGQTGAARSGLRAPFAIPHPSSTPLTPSQPLRCAPPALLTKIDAPQRNSSTHTPALTAMETSPPTTTTITNVDVKTSSVFLTPSAPGPPPLQMRTARDALLTELDALRRDAEASRASAAKAAEGSRAAWAAEKAALAKRHAAALKELAARQEGELRKAKRKARGAQVAVAQLTDEVADLKVGALYLALRGFLSSSEARNQASHSEDSARWGCGAADR